MAAAVIALVAVFGPLGGADDDDDVSGRLTAENVGLRNEFADFRQTGDRTIQVQGTMPTVDVLLTNRDAKPAVVTKVEVEIDAYANLIPCYVQGGGPVAIETRYAIHLPVRPRQHEFRVVKEIPRHIDPGRSDRFIMRFGNPLREDDNRHLYALRIRLATGATGGSIDVGRFVLAAPGPLESRGIFLPEDDAVLGQVVRPGGARARTIEPSRTWCYRHNMAEVERVLKVGGQMDPEVKALRKVFPAALWRKWQDRTPARRAALRLARGAFDDPILAVTAAVATDDETFARAIRRRSASNLLQQARRALAEQPSEGLAIDRARASLEILETPEAVELLATAERRRQRRPAGTAP